MFQIPYKIFISFKEILKEQKKCQKPHDQKSNQHYKQKKFNEYGYETSLENKKEEAYEEEDRNDDEEKKDAAEKDEEEAEEEDQDMIIMKNKKMAKNKKKKKQQQEKTTKQIQEKKKQDEQAVKEEEKGKNVQTNYAFQEKKIKQVIPERDLCFLEIKEQVNTLCTM